MEFTVSAQNNDKDKQEPLDAKPQRGIRRTVELTLLAVALVIGVMVYNVTRTPTIDREGLSAQVAVLLERPSRITDFELVEHLGELFEQQGRFTEFELVDDRGEVFRRDHCKDTWTFIFFGFTHCPDICPLALADLSRLVNELPAELAEQTQVLMVSLDPSRDTPDVLADYVPYFHEDFIGVTGEFLTIRRFANELNVAFAKVTQGDDYTVDHSGHITLINPKGDYHAIFSSPFHIGPMQTAYRTIVRSFPF